MKTSEFATIVTEMIQAEPEVFQEFIEKEDWDGLHDEVYEYVSQG